MRAIILIASILLAGPQTGGWGFGGNPRPTSSLAQFEAFGTSGTGTSGVCSTSNPKGARGETLTFTRASSATCTKTISGLSTTGIANGDLVVLSSNIARVEYDSTGVLGLFVEASRTNSELRSEEFDNAAWTKTGVVVAAPTITANAAVSPDGATTAEQVDLVATGVGEASVVRQTVSGSVCNAVTCVYSIYVKGVSGSGTIDIGGWGTIVTVTSCSFVSTSWTRCFYVAAGGNAGSGLFFGNDTRDNGGTTRPAQSIYAWGGQGEVGAYLTSYIPTTSAAVTRAAETGSFALPVAISSNTGSHAASFQIPAVSSVVVNLVRYQATAQPLYFYPASQFVRTYDGTTEVTNNSPAPSIGTVYRVSSYYTGSTQAATDWTPDTTTGAFDGTMGATPLVTVTICGLDGSQASFICTRICADSNATRCR